MRSRGCALAYRAPDVEGRALECRPSTSHPLCRDQPETEVRRCGESATTTLSTMVSPGIVRLVLALSAKGHHIAVNCDSEVVLLDARQLGCDHDPVLMSVDIDRRESG